MKKAVVTALAFGTLLSMGAISAMAAEPEMTFKYAELGKGSNNISQSPGLDKRHSF